MKALDKLVPKTPQAHREAVVQKQVLEFGMAVRAARLAHNWSQGDLAGHSGVPQADISRIENGVFQQGPTAVTLCRLAQALDMQIALIPGGDTDETPTEASENLPDLIALRQTIREELAAFALSLNRHSEKFNRGSSPEKIQLVPFVARYVDAAVQEDLTRLVEDLSRSIQQSKVSSK